MKKSFLSAFLLLYAKFRIVPFFALWRPLEHTRKTPFHYIGKNALIFWRPLEHEKEYGFLTS
jgi:hypothetical protein